MTDLVIVRRCLSLEEAQVACSFLRSAGMEAEPGNQFLASVYWKFAFALGFDVRVRVEDAADARAAFVEVDRGSFADPEVAPLRRGTLARLMTLSLAFG